MGGRVWRMFPVETHRGCPYKYSFCNSPSQMAMYRDELGENYLWRKTFDNMFRELNFYKEEMGAARFFVVDQEPSDTGVRQAVDSLQP